MALIVMSLASIRMLAVSIALAVGRIWANKMRSTLTMVGIVIAVAAVVSTVGGLTGLRAFVMNEFTAMGTNRLEAWPKVPDSGPLRHASRTDLCFLPKQFEGALEHCPTLTHLALVCTAMEPVRHGSSDIDEASILGVENGWEKIENRPIVSGRFFTLTEQQNGEPVCCVTPDVRDKLMLDRDCVGERIVIGKRTYTVVGVIQPPPQLKVLYYDRASLPEIAMPFKTVYKGYRRYVEAGATFASPEAFDEAEAEMRFFLRRSRGIGLGEPDTFGISNMEGELESFKSVTLAITAVAACIVAISLVVGGIGIMNIMLVSVSERTREIGLRKAVGAPATAIMAQFLIEAVVLGVTGGLVGVAAGYALTTCLAAIPGFPLSGAQVPAWSIIAAFGFSSATGILSGMLPAIKAARLNPIEALRHE